MKSGGTIPPRGRSDSYGEAHPHGLSPVVTLPPPGASAWSGSSPTWGTHALACCLPGTFRSRDVCLWLRVSG